MPDVAEFDECGNRLRTSKNEQIPMFDRAVIPSARLYSVVLIAKRGLKHFAELPTAVAGHLKVDIDLRLVPCTAGVDVQ